MPDDLYERDVLVWAERQADFLRRLGAGERVNDAVDWPNVIEEVQDVGLSELRACRSLLRQALVRLLKLRAWPDSPAAAHWRGETAGFLSVREVALPLPCGNGLILPISTPTRSTRCEPGQMMV
jgi:hypothetical protein